MGGQRINECPGFVIISCHAKDNHDRADKYCLIMNDVHYAHRLFALNRELILLLTFCHVSP